jgi:hypothetical protein
MLIHYAVVAVLALVLSAPADAQVRVDIGFNLPAPPPLVVVPGVSSVRYAPQAPGNFFFYGNQYWVFTPGGWHVSRRHDGPWVFVAPQFVPRPVLSVPVRYYHVPPGHWKQWQRQAPPRWEREWGHDWADKRAWKYHHHDRDDHRGPEPRHVHRKAHGHGHGKSYGRDR